jgi:hypothetical protein
VVDDQSDGDRNVFVTEDLDGLAGTVLIDLEIPLLQIGDEVSGMVVNNGLEHDEVDVD